jgi:carotenoid cleavage dioxygenase-like enzyme
MSRPDWLFDAVEIKLCSGINDFELTGVEVEGQTIYVCLVFIDVNFETGEGGNDVLQNIDMSNTLVNTIGLSTFYSCTSLTSITLPDSLTSIGSGAFANCTSLMLVTSLPTIPPSLSQLVFFNTHADLIIKVPAQSVNTYKTATNWKSYASKISAI